MHARLRARTHTLICAHNSWRRTKKKSTAAILETGGRADTQTDQGCITRQATETNPCGPMSSAAEGRRASRGSPSPLHRLQKRRAGAVRCVRACRLPLQLSRRRRLVSTLNHVARLEEEEEEGKWRWRWLTDGYFWEHWRKLVNTLLQQVDLQLWIHQMEEGVVSSSTVTGWYRQGGRPPQRLILDTLNHRDPQDLPTCCQKGQNHNHKVETQTYVIQKPTF